MERLLLRPDEAAIVLGLARSTLYALLARGELPSLRVGNSLRVPAAELREWVERRTSAVTREAKS
jgi:excisionase family DNA binding protein